MSNLYLKKSLGQHFLKDESVLQKIADAIGDMSVFKTVVEIGPGMGALTKYLLPQKHSSFYAVELDDRWAEHLANTHPVLQGKIIHEDVLKADLSFMQNPTHILGNFPYNISTQIVFRLIEEREKIAQMTGMFQKEVALRIAAEHGSKDYGVMSVLTQTYFNCEYLFDVAAESFNPPPKVVSGVIRLKRKETPLPVFDEVFFKRVVKAAFNQRRKTMRNSLKELVNDKSLLAKEIFNLRPEQISVSEFQALSNLIQKQ
ncbi:MAG: 16S rRNA (adenine(1518)-N(6)/adenine(1519)-N(6))-dimethyltransferase RsmA [Chitinophagales bacterium]